MRKLGELNVVGIRVPVLHVTAKELPGTLDEVTSGAFETNSSTIYLQRFPAFKPQPTALWANLIHELLHAIAWECGVYLAFKDVLPRWTVEARDELEERIIVAIAPELARDLVRVRFDPELVCAAQLEFRILRTDGYAALAEALPHYSPGALGALVERIAERFSSGLQTACASLKNIYASIRKVAK